MLAVMGAVGAGVAFGSIWLPIIGLAVGIPITAALSTMSHDHRQKQIRSHYRDEIGATLGIDPHSVTINDLRTVANGDPQRGIPPNQTLKEAIQRNDRGRSIAIVANVLSAVAAAGIVAVMHFASLPSALAEFLGPSMSQIFGSSSGVEATVLAGVAGVASFGLDQAFARAGRTMFDYTQPSLYERIDLLSLQQRRSQSIAVSQVMALVEEVNPGVKNEIFQRFGLPFRQLPPAQQQDVIDHYDAEFHLKATTEAVNLGLMPVHELAFAIEGRRSGALPPASTLIEAYQRERADAEARGVSLAPTAPAHLLDHVPGVEHARRFVERFRHPSASPDRAAQTHVQRLEQQSALPAVGPTIH